MIHLFSAFILSSFLLLLPVGGKIDISPQGINEKITIAQDYLKKTTDNLSKAINVHKPKPGDKGVVFDSSLVALESKEVFIKDSETSKLVEELFQNKVLIENIFISERRLFVDVSLDNGSTLRFSEPVVVENGKTPLTFNMTPSLIGGEYGLSATLETTSDSINDNSRHFKLLKDSFIQSLIMISEYDESDI